MANLYLLAYNALLFAGWAFCLYLTILTAFVEKKGTEQVWQVASRQWLLWGIIVPVGKTVTSGSLQLLNIAGVTLQLNFTTLMLAWCTSEIIRYGFFALKEVGASPYPALWLRYTGFIVLYPLGVSSELALVYLALPAIKASRMWSVDLPNRLNFGFDYYIACIIGMATYAPFFPVLFGHMLAQRKKNLRPKAKAE